MDSERLACFGVIFIVFGLYLQSFGDFMIRVMGAIMIIFGSLILAFILGAYLGRGKIEYDKLYRGNYNV